MGRLDGRVAWITGAASGIGLACAQRFAAEGAAVAGFDLEECPDWKSVSDLAPQASYTTGDVRDEAHAVHLAQALAQVGALGDSSVHQRADFVDVL